MEFQQPYHIMLDYKGYLIEPRSYRVMPAPLMGTRFATGRQAYANLDFWQVGAMTDFTHGINQKFLVDPSAFFLSIGIDPSRPGEIKLERDLKAETPLSGDYIFTNDSKDVTGTETKFLTELLPGCHIQLETDDEWVEVETIESDTALTLKEKYTGTGGTGSATLAAVTLSETPGIVTAHYRSATAIYLGTSTGKILKSLDGITFEEDGATGTGKIYGFYEIDGKLFATKGSGKTWVYNGSWVEAEAPLSGNYIFTNDSKAVTGTDTKFLSELWPGCHIQLEVDGVWFEVDTIESDTALTLKLVYSEAGVDPGSATLAVEDLYFVMVESDYGFGIFDDGIRRSEDGLSWVPVPPDPLWVLPSSEGIALNAIAIPRGFVIGSKRGFWLFVGGSSGMNLWMFPDYVSDNNFKGMEKWGHYAIFSVENQGIFYTDGVSIYPTNLNYLNEGFVFKNCKSIVSSGWDILALVSDGTDWYLARCNLNYAKIPKYWWLVKKLAKTPSHLASFSDEKVLIFYDDETAEVYNKISGPYQLTGHLITSLIDENLIRLQKFYKAISSIFEAFPVTDTSVKLGYRFNIADAFTEKTIVGADQREAVYSLRNPTVENRIQIKLTLITIKTTKSPVVGDLCWTYVLERPSEEAAVTRNFYFTIIGEDRIEKLTGDVEETGKEEPRTREEIINDLWTTRAKKELFNFVGADNKRELGLIVKYTGAGASCLMTIDRTNYEIKTYIDDVLDKTIVYKDKTIKQISDIINGYTDYTCEVHQDQEDSRSAHDFEPIKELEVKGSAYIHVGSAIHCVIFNPQSPGQIKLAVDGRGSDRINMSLREA